MANPTISQYDIDLVSQHGIFDALHYSQQAPDLQGLSLPELIRHYLEIGWHEQLDPHPLFSTKYYLTRYPDLVRNNANPLIHYVRYGHKEDRSPHLLFDPVFYRKKYMADADPKVSPYGHYVQVGEGSDARPNEFFIPCYYRAQIKVGAAQPVHLLNHYLESGWRDGLATSPLFDTGFYLRRHPDLQKSTMNPLEHFLRYGRKEGRASSALAIKLEHTQDISFVEWTALLTHLLPPASPVQPALQPQPRIALVISVHNASPDTVIACLESVERQITDGWGVVLVNDGVTSRSVLQAIASYTSRNPGARVIVNELQLHSWQPQSALREANNPDFLLHIDCTELLAPNALERITQKLSAPSTSQLFVLPGQELAKSRPIDLQGFVAIHRDLAASYSANDQELYPVDLLPSSPEAPLSYREYLRMARPAPPDIKRGPLPAVKSAAIYVHSKGNVFFRQIADTLVGAFKENHWAVQLRDDSAYPAPDVTLHIIVAPHEFYGLMSQGTGQKVTVPENTILFNTEQPWTQWFRLAKHYFPLARKIWDMDYTSYRRLLSLGYDCAYLPLGSAVGEKTQRTVATLPACGLSEVLPALTRNFSSEGLPWESRPIDILFIGGLSAKRNQFFARHAEFFHKHECYLHFFDSSEPIQLGKNTEMGPEMSIGLIQRSKILLNVHRGDEPYFEWQRIVMQGIANGAVVVTEPCTPAVPFRDGVDYLTAELDQLPKLLASLLTTPQGREQATTVARHGAARYFVDCNIGPHLNRLLSDVF